MAADPASEAARGRLRLALAAAAGTLVDVATVDGAHYRGVLAAASLLDPHPAGEAALTLRMARPDGHAACIPELTVPLPALLRMAAANVALAGERPKDTPHRTAPASFPTDAQIAPATRSAGRSLEKFDHFEAPSHPSVEAALSDFPHAPRGRTKWDQFEANRRQFGVRTSYNEEEYTTRLDRSAPDFAARLKDADRIAAEIEGAATANPHLAEERGAQRPADIDEEAMYGSVARPAATKAPPAAAATAAAAAAAASSSASASTTTSAPASASSQRPQFPSFAAALKGDKALAERPPARTASVESMPALDSPRRGLAASLRETRASHDSLAHLDMLKESKNVRRSLSGAASPASASRSPINTSLVGDLSTMASLNLERSTPKLAPEVVESYEEYKAGMAQEQNAEVLRKLKGTASNLVRSPSISMKDSKLRRSSTDASPSPSIDSGSESGAKDKMDEKGSAEKPPRSKPKPFDFDVNAEEFVPAAKVQPPQRHSAPVQDPHPQQPHHPHQPVVMSHTHQPYGMVPPHMPGVMPMGPAFVNPAVMGGYRPDVLPTGFVAQPGQGWIDPRFVQQPLVMQQYQTIPMGRTSAPYQYPAAYQRPPPVPGAPNFSQQRPAPAQGSMAREDQARPSRAPSTAPSSDQTGPTTKEN